MIQLIIRCHCNLQHPDILFFPHMLDLAGIHQDPAGIFVYLASLFCSFHTSCVSLEKLHAKLYLQRFADMRLRCI